MYAVDSTAERSWRERLEFAVAHGRFYFLQHRLTPLEEYVGPLFVNRSFLRDYDCDIGQEEFQAAADACRMGRRIDRLLVPAVLRAICHGRADESHLIAIGASSLRDPSFPTWLGRQLDEKHVKGNRLVLQVPVTAATAHRTDATRLCDALTAIGCRYAFSAVDDNEQHWRVCRELGAAMCVLSHNLVAALQAGAGTRWLPGGLSRTSRGDGIAIIAEGAPDTRHLARLWRAGVNLVGADWLQQAPRPVEPPRCVGLAGHP